MYNSFDYSQHEYIYLAMLLFILDCLYSSGSWVLTSSCRWDCIDNSPCLLRSCLPPWGLCTLGYCQSLCPGRGLSHYYSQLAQTQYVIGSCGLISLSRLLIGQDTLSCAVIGWVWCWHWWRHSVLRTEKEPSRPDQSLSVLRSEKLSVSTTQTIPGNPDTGESNPLSISFDSGNFIYKVPVLYDKSSKIVL